MPRVAIGKLEEVARKIGEETEQAPEGGSVEITKIALASWWLDIDHATRRLKQALDINGDD